MMTVGTVMVEDRIPTDFVSRTVWARGGKRLFDVLFAGGLILVISPLLIVCALAVKLTSPGPVLFSQIRAGYRGRPFRVYKFRTMRGGRKPDPKELVPLDHPEITAVGRILRRFKLDEFPQLFNVLLGDMTAVGPRPTLMDQVERYTPFQARRLNMRPGMSSLANVNGAASIEWEERIRYDVYQVWKNSLWLDTVILWKTIGVVLFGEWKYARHFKDSPYAAEMKAAIPDADFELGGGARQEGNG